MAMLQLFESSFYLYVLLHLNHLLLSSGEMKHQLIYACIYVCI